MQIGIIGAGKVGCSMGKYIMEHTACKKAGIRVTGYAGRSKESVETAATFTGTTAFGSMQDLIKKVISYSLPHRTMRLPRYGKK